MRRDQGFTLIELTVVILLLGVMGLVTTSVVINGFHRQAEIDGRAIAIEQVRTALQRTVREIREADFPLLAITTSELDMTLTDSGGVTRICYSAAATNGVNDLVRVVSPVNKTCTDANAQHYVVATNLATTDVFSVPYPAANYQDFTGLNSADCSETADPTTYEQQCAGAINVRLMVIPINANTHTDMCPTGVSASACDIDISDTAQLRNTP